ncbi:MULTISPECIES: hypothetical protein [Streptomyces]|uniref:ATP-binding protein n=1 Tax=Streptomyces luteosporeus TaxID=173856 RepID=A0ABN3TK94_9ACTN
MKQVSLRALGVAVAGAAIAVGAAGTASAGTLESLTTTATGAYKGLPMETATTLLPAGGPVASATDRAVKSGLLEQSARAADTALNPHLHTDKLAGPAEKLAGTTHQKASATANAPATAPADNKGNAGLLGALPTKSIAPNGLSLPGLGTPNTPVH